MQLQEITVRPITEQEVGRYQALMQAHHYLRASRSIGETLRYVAFWRNQGIALISFSSAALKCAARDQWIGWPYRHQFDRLNLLTNNSRFLILLLFAFHGTAEYRISLYITPMALSQPSFTYAFPVPEKVASRLAGAL